MQKFTEEDIERFRKWINHIGTKMSYDAGLKLPDLVSAYKDLAWIQSSLIPLMEANIFQVVEKVTETAEDRASRAEEGSE